MIACDLCMRKASKSNSWCFLHHNSLLGWCFHAAQLSPLQSMVHIRSFSWTENLKCLLWTKVALSHTPKLMSLAGLQVCKRLQLTSVKVITLRVHLLFPPALRMFNGVYMNCWYVISLISLSIIVEVIKMIFCFKLTLKKTCWFQHSVKI